MSPILARACIACALVISGSWACARGGELTLADALDAALRNHPDSRASAFELSAAQARSVQANLRPNPELALELENFGGSGAASDTGALETTLSLSQVLELGGRRRRDAVRPRRSSRLQASSSRRGSSMYLRKLRHGSSTPLPARSRSNSRSSRCVSRNSRSTRSTGASRPGDRPLAEQSRARIALTRARIERRQAESELGTARHVLAASWAARSQTSRRHGPSSSSCAQSTPCRL